MSPGQTLRDALKARGWSQGQLAQMLHVKPPYVSDLVRGKVGISARMAVKLGSAFGEPLDSQYWISVQRDFDLKEAANQEQLADA